MPGDSRIALLTANIWAATSSPLINTLLFLTARKKSCDVYYEYHPDFDAAKVNEPPTFSPQQRNIRNLYPYHRNPFWRLPVLMAGLNRHHSHLQVSLFQLWKERYQFSIGYDPEGAIRAYLLSKRRGTPYLVHSLELAEGEVGGLERKAFHGAKAVLTTDTHRGEIVARKYGLPDNKVIPLPNSSMGEFQPAKISYLRDKLGIAHDQLIVLCTGSLIKEHCVDVIIEGVLEWPAGFVLVLHGWALCQEYRYRVHAINALRPNSIFISEEMLPFQDKHLVFSSADIGIVAFSGDSFNHLHGAASAGKLFDFCQAGVPILANDIPGMRSLVEGNKIGVVITSFLHAAPVLAALKSRENYLPACEEFFTRHEFSRCFETILSRLDLI